MLDAILNEVNVFQYRVQAFETSTTDYNDDVDDDDDGEREREHTVYLYEI